MDIHRWLARGRQLILALAGAFTLLTVTSGSPAVPVLAASSITSSQAVAATTGTATLNQLVQALMTGSRAYTPEQLSGARAYLLAHPFNGAIQVTTSSPTLGRFQPNLSVGVGWTGVTIHLTNADVVGLFTTIVTYGAAAAAAALCAPGVWLAVVCGFFGAIAGWIIVTIVLQATNNFHGCGLTIFMPWWGSTSWHCG